MYSLVRKKFWRIEKGRARMPQYFYSSVYTTLATSSQLADNIPTAIQPTIQQTTTTTDPTTTSSSSSCCCPSTTTFLSTLVDKLYTMASRLKDQFDALEAKTQRTPQRGIIFAEIDTSVGVSIKYEYVIYIEKYGPPIDGIFDETLLAQIRAEMAVSA